MNTSALPTQQLRDLAAPRASSGPLAAGGHDAYRRVDSFTEPHSARRTCCDPGGQSNSAVIPSDLQAPLFLAEADRWRDRALCCQTDPDAFFPEQGGSVREAKRICQGCEVRTECLEYALSHDERFGVWGGLSERERRRLKRMIS
jgi:WhiB family redox-sensing transcriptional regulator